METRDILNSTQAQKAIHYLNRTLSLNDTVTLSEQRDRALKALDDARNADLYEEIQAKLGKNDITPYEYLFYALVTDDVKTVDHNILASILGYIEKLPHYIYRNLIIVAAALRFERATSEAARTKYHAELINELSYDLRYENAVRPVFLNLAGIHLTGLDCSKERTSRAGYMPSLSFCDLNSASFTDCNFYSLKLRHSDISHASFENITNGKNGLDGDFNLHGCIAKGALFDRVTASNIDWSYSNFSGAQFTNSDIGPGCYRKSNFTDAVFANTSLTFSGSYGTYEANFTNADFTSARLTDTDFADNTFTNARFIAPKDASELSAEVTRLTTAFIQDLSGSPVYVERKLAAFQQIITADVARYIQSLDMSEDEKNNLSREVMKHDLFHYEYMEATKSLVAEPFPRQKNTVICYGDYDDEHFTYKLDAPSLQAYKSFYAYGMSVIKKIADAINKPETLEQFTAEYENQILADLQQMKASTPLEKFPKEIRDKNPQEILEFAKSHMIKYPKDEMGKLSQQIQSVLILAHLEFMNHCLSGMAQHPEWNDAELNDLLQSWHPLMSLKYYDKSNCLAPYYFGENNGAFHGVDDLIKEFTSEARVTPKAMVNTPLVSNVAETLFSKPAGDVVRTSDDAALSYPSPKL